MRGVFMDYSPELINEFWKLPKDTPCAYEKFFEGDVDAQASRVLDIIAQPGETWEPYSPRLLPFRSLHAEAAVWGHFLRSSLLPTSHGTTLSFEKQVLLSLILEKKPVNIGRIVSDNISACVNKKEGFLLFPCLITELLMYMGLEKEDGDVVEKKNSSIDKVAVDRFKKNHPAERRPQTELVDAAASTKVMTELKELKDQVKELVEGQRKMMKKIEAMEANQMKVWKYERQRSEWEGGIFIEMSPDQETSIPVFPEDVTTSPQHP